MNQKYRNIIACFTPFLVYIGVMLVVMFGFAVYASGVTSGSVEEAEKFVKDNALLMTTVINFALLPVFYLMWMNDRKDYPLKKANLPSFTWAILVMIGASACVGLNYFLNMFMPKEILESYTEASEVLWKEDGQVLSFISVVIAAPMAEEFLSRGLIYTRLRIILAAPYTIIITAVAFGIYHGNMLQFMYALALGLILAYMMEAYRSLWAPIMVHMSANLISWVLTYVVQIPSDNGGSLDISVMSGSLLIAATGLYSIINIRKRMKNKAKSEEVK